jgi:hypothetical protein
MRPRTTSSVFHEFAFFVKNGGVRWNVFRENAPFSLIMLSWIDGWTAIRPCIWILAPATDALRWRLRGVAPTYLSLAWMPVEIPCAMRRARHPPTCCLLPPTSTPCRRSWPGGRPGDRPGTCRRRAGSVRQRRCAGDCWLVAAGRKRADPAEFRAAWAGSVDPGYARQSCAAGCANHLGPAAGLRPRSTGAVLPGGLAEPHGARDPARSGAQLRCVRSC